MRRQAVALGLTLGFALAISLIGVAAAQEPTTGVAFAGKDEVNVSIKDGSGKATVTVVNGGPATTITWTVALAAGKDGKARSATIVPAESAITERSTSIIELTFTTVTATGKLSGVLVGTPASPGAPITRTLTLANFGLKLPLEPGAIILYALVVAGGVVALRYATLPEDITGPLGNAKWSYSESWATTFTGAGALLATLVSAGALPDEPYLLTKSEFAALAVFFAALGLVAPILFQALNGAIAPVFVFHVASWITTAGVLGQLGTVVLLLIDASGQEPGSPLVIGIGAATLAAAVSIFFYVYRGIPGTLRNAKGVSGSLRGSSNAWSLL